MLTSALCESLFNAIPTGSKPVGWGAALPLPTSPLSVLAVGFAEVVVEAGVGPLLSILAELLLSMW